MKASTDGFAPPPREASAAVPHLMAVALLDVERSGEPERMTGLLEQWLDPVRESWRLPLVYRSLPAVVRLCLSAGDEPGWL